VNFFLDENFPRNAFVYLTNLGHTVIDIRGTSFEGTDDATMFDLAQQHCAFFLTTDKDFYHTIPHLKNSHYGIIVISLRQPNSISILSKLEWAYNFVLKNPIQNCCLMLTDTKIFYHQR